MIKAFFQTYSIVPHKTLYFLPQPQNTHKKNSTLIQTTTGPVTVPYSMKTVIKKYRMLTQINEIFLRNCICKVTKKKNLLPIPIRHDLVLMPVKVHVPETGLRVYGYLNASLIQSIEESGSSTKTSRILFQNEKTLFSPQSTRSLEHNHLCAKFVETLYFSPGTDDSPGMNLALQESTPAWPEWEPV